MQLLSALGTLGAATCGALILSGLAAAQNSDECSTATPVMGLGTFPVDTTAATTSGNSPCGGIGQDVWFAWTALATEIVEFSTCASASWDTALAIYGGSCGNLSLLDCNDDSCILQSRVRISAIAGQTYMLRVGAFHGGSGGVGTFTAAMGGSGAGCTHPTTGPDVIVGQINGVSTYGAIGNTSAYALGTTACNVGDQELNWIGNVNQHPVISQNIFRMEDGRFEQIGLGWLKHGFTALQQDLCCICTHSGTATRLGIGCSDPYASGLNGSQGGLGPRSQVNAFTGTFPYPFQAQGQTGDRIYKRIQVLTDDVDPSLHPSARYFGEGQYVTRDDAVAGNGVNNISYCVLDRSTDTTQGAFRLTVANGSTVREVCAVRGWEASDSSVVAEDISVPGEGLFVAGSNAVDNGDGTWTYNYAICNINSDDSGRAFSVPLGHDVVVSDVGMSFPLYHSGEPYSNIPWTSTVNTNDVLWETETFAQNINANALRWGTTYSFWFTANAAPLTATARLGLFKPASPDDQFVALIAPGDGSISSVVIANYCMARPNSTGQTTAIVASSVDLVARTMQLESLNMPQNAVGFFITSPTEAFVPSAGGSNGNLCIGGSIGRGVGSGILNSGTMGSFHTAVDLDMIPTPMGMTSFMAGETRYFQSWHRDSIIGIPTSNFSDGVRVRFP